MTDTYNYLCDIFDYSNVQHYYNDLHLTYLNCTIKIPLFNRDIGFIFGKIRINCYGKILFYINDHDVYPKYSCFYIIKVDYSLYDKIFALDNNCLFYITVGNTKIKVRDNSFIITTVKCHKNTILYSKDTIIENVNINMYNGKLIMDDKQHDITIRIIKI